MAAITCVCAQIALPIPPVPITLQTVATGLAGLVLIPSHAAVSMIVYLALGGLGLPVFSGFKGGIGVLLGPTAGFLFGFLGQAWVTSWVYRRKSKPSWTWLVLSLAAGLIPLFASGALWLAWRHKKSVSDLAAIFLPLLPGAALKIWMSAALYRSLEPRLDSLSLGAFEEKN